MLNIKIIILFVGIFLMTIGFVNNQKPTVNEKQVFKPFPRNVYDEIWLSQPSLLYDRDLNHKMNSTYILDDASDYTSLFQKTPYLSKRTSDKYSDINKRIEYYKRTSGYDFKDK